MQSHNKVMGRDGRASWLAMVIAVLLCVFALAEGARLSAQNRNAGEITGTVQDATGGVVAGVFVKALNTDTGQVTQATTNDTGGYTMPFVPIGHYSVSFTKDGYDTYVESNIKLSVQTVTLNPKLSVGKVATEVRVDASTSPLLAEDSSEINLTLPSEMLVQLPNVGGDWKFLTGLLPGVAPGRYTNGSGGGLSSQFYVSINGAQADQYSLLLDGGVSANTMSGDPGNTEPPLDAIAELNVSTALFGADTGNGTSSFNVITKGGTNKFHGSLWERIQNDFFEAKPFNQSGAIPKFRWNQYGFTAGGPAIKNKLFFFGSYQRNPIVQPGSGFYTVPEDAVRGIGTTNGDAVFDPAIYGIIYDPTTTTIVNGIKTRKPFANNTIPASRISSVSKAVLQYFPKSNEPYTNGNNYSFSGSAPVTNQLFSYRADYDLAKNNRLSASGNYSTNKYTNPYPAQTPGYFNYSQQSNNMTGQITDAWTINPSMLNELRLAIFHQNSTWTTGDTKVLSNLGFKNMPFDVFPHVNMWGGPRTPYYLNGDLFALQKNMVYQGGDSLTWTKGKHSMKFGGEFNKGLDDFAWNQINAGWFNFSGAATTNPNLNENAQTSNAVGGSGIADFLLGDALNYFNNVPVIPRRVIGNVQAYGQDSFKALPNLTVNLGLRFLYQQGLTVKQGWFSNFDPTLTNPANSMPGAVRFGTTGLGTKMEKNKLFFQPRLGVSYAPAKGWVVRGGVGLYNIPWTTGNLSGNNTGNGYSGFVNVQPDYSQFEPGLQWDSPVPSVTFPKKADLKPDLFNGQGVNYQPYDTPVSSLWEYQAGIQHLFGGYLVDVAYVGTKGNNIAFTSDYTQNPRGKLGSFTHPFPQYSNVSYWLMNGTSNYNSLQVQSKKQFANGFIYQVTYTYAKSLDTGTGQGGIGAGAIEIYQDAYDPMANYGPANSDLRHVFSGSVLYELPFGTNKPLLNTGKWMDELVGGWQIASTFQAHSGNPFTVTSGGPDNSGRYTGGIWFANRVSHTGLRHRSQQQWFNPNDYGIPAADTLGNVRRNSIFGPNFNQVDLSASKKFRLPKLGEATYFQFKVDAFNAFNHPNLGLPNATIYGNPGLNQSSGSGVIGGAIGGNGSNGSGMRTLQLEGHIYF